MGKIVKKSLVKGEMCFDYHELFDIIETKHNIKVNDYHRMFGQTGHNARVAYSNYWHFIMDVALDLSWFRNGSVVSIDWAKIKTYAEKYDEDDEPGWRSIITNFAIQEVGVGENFYEIYW